MSKVKLIASFILLAIQIQNILLCRLDEGASLTLVDKDSTTCKDTTLSETKCQFACKTGYTESIIRAQCSLDKWQVVPACTLQSCGKPNGTNYKFYVNIKLDSLTSNGNFKSDVNLKLYFISFNSSKLSPIYTIVLQDSKNKLQALNASCERATYFYKHPCTELKSFQVSHDDFSNTGYDRGHLVPNEAMCFAQKAAYATFLTSNIAAQDPTTNRQYWRLLEEKVSDFSHQYPSIVITGVCSDLIEKKGKLNVPKCYFKLFCSHVELSNQTYTVVFGVHALNSNLTTSDEKSLRQKQTQTLLSKSELDKITKVYLDDAWQEAKELIDSQNSALSRPVKLPDTNVCKTAAAVELNNLPKNVLDLLTKSFTG